MMYCYQRVVEKTKISKQKGVAAVEFSLVVFVMLLIVAGIFEFGRALWYYDALAKATRDGARFLSTSSTLDTATAKDIVNNARLTANIPDLPNVPDFKATNILITCEPTCDTPEYVTVSVEYPIVIGGVIPINWSIGSASFDSTLSPHTTMRYMQGS